MELLRPHDSEGPHPLMSSSPIAAIVGHRPTDTTQPAAVTDSEQQGLSTALAAGGEPRDPPGKALENFKGRCYGGNAKSSSVLATKPWINSGRYCIRLSRLLTTTAS